MKVNIPNQSTGKRYIHDLSHDVNTTSDFGFLQPVLCREVEGNSNVYLSVHQLVRMMPMVYPTFGRLTLNTYSVFVPIESVYHPYGSLRAGQTYQGAGATYIPDMVISGSAALFSLILKCLSAINVIEIGNGIAYGGEYVMGDTANFQVVPPPASGTGLLTTIMNLWKDKVSTFVFGAASDVPSTWYQYQSYLAIPSTPVSDPDLLNTERYDWIDAIEYQGNVYLVCGEYSIAARNIRKVGYGLGYKALWDNELLSFLPFFAYYKGWFDLFNPERDITWKDTNAAAIQEWMEQYGRFNLISNASGSLIKVRGQQLMNFFLDIAQCYYTASPDFVSVAITGQNIDVVPQEVRNYMTLNNNYQGIGGTAASVQNGGVGISNSANIAINPANNVSVNVLTQPGLNLLRAMYYRRNAHRVAGGDIEAFMKAMLGTEYKDEDDSFWIGSQRLDIAMTPVFSNADTMQGSGSGTWLGAFAGQGSGAHSDRNRPEEWHYTCKYDGYVLTYIALVPESRYAQGIDMNLKHVRKVDFFDPAFDSYSLAPTAKKFIYAEQQLDVLDSPQDFGAAFGNHPIYIEKCVAQNILNGDMSLKSTRATYLPFTLDKLLPYTQTEQIGQATYITNFRSTLLVNGPIWRYIGLYPWIGNYGRIFENAGNADYQGSAVGNPIFYTKGYDDNNVVDNYISLKVSSYKIPVADSFQTGSLDGRDTMALNIS